MIARLRVWWWRWRAWRALDERQRRPRVWFALDTRRWRRVRAQGKKP